MNHASRGPRSVPRPCSIWNNRTELVQRLSSRGTLIDATDQRESVIHSSIADPQVLSRMVSTAEFLVYPITDALCLVGFPDHSKAN